MDWLPLSPFAIFFAWLFFDAMRRRRPCPDCGHPLPVFQSPEKKSKRQWIEGGSVCSHCGCETDYSGAKVAPGTPPSVRSVVLGVSLLAIAALPAIAMLCYMRFRVP
jgi:hypothetical protein